MTYSAISPLTVGKFHAEPRHARKAAAAARRDRLRALPCSGPNFLILIRQCYIAIIESATNVITVLCKSLYNVICHAVDVVYQLECNGNVDFSTNDILQMSPVP